MPVPGCWTISRRGESSAPISVGAGEFTADYAMEPQDPEPVTTIAWRLAHIIVGVFGMRNASHFGGPPVDYETFSYAGTAAEALRQLDEAYEAWIKGVRGLGAEGLAQPCGPAEGPFARGLDGHPGPAYPPRGHPSRRRDRAAAGPLPAHRTLTCRILLTKLRLEYVNRRGPGRCDAAVPPQGFRTAIG